MTEQEIHYILKNNHWPYKATDLLKLLIILLPALILIGLHYTDFIVIAAVGGIAAIGVFKWYKSYFFIEYKTPHGKEDNTKNLVSAFKQLDHNIIDLHDDFVLARGPSSMVSSGSFIMAIPLEERLLLNARSAFGIRFKKDLDTMDIIGSIANGEENQKDSVKGDN
ncbi:MAG: hypothetical protein WD267_12590 [Balneolales bacterium]